MKVTLIRDFNSDMCTLGKMSFSTPAADFACETMERPWIAMPGARGGLSGKSCVPKGTYKLERHSSEAHPNTWALVNPDLDVFHYEDPLKPYVRALVLIHVCNYARELRGCIGVGFGRTTDSQGVRMITNSKRAMIDLKRLLPWDDSHTLEIR